MTAIDLVGYIACGLVLTTFCMNSLMTLRISAILSNLAFISYAYFQDLPPIMMLHAVLFFINGFHLSKHTKQMPSEKNASD